MGAAVDQARLMLDDRMTPDEASAAAPTVAPPAAREPMVVRDARKALDAHRAEMRSTADRLGKATRHAMDIPSRFRERLERDPVRTIAYVAGATTVVAYLVAGGPSKTVRALRRRTRGFRDGDRAYEGLPGGLRSLVDASVPGHGVGRDDARREMAMAIQAWRADPKNRRRADEMVGDLLTPPGASRVFWVTLEAALTTAAAMIIRGIVLDTTMHTLAGGTRTGRQPFGPPQAGAADSGAGPDRPKEYTGWSGRGQSSPAEPGREP